jgi:hypothetical protein
MSYEFRGMVIPDKMCEILVAYVDKGWEPGHFLQAVICNDLSEACARADHLNMQILPAYAAWLYNEAPSTCWGSKAKMDAWVAEKEDERQSNEAAAARQKREDDADERGDALYDQQKDDRLTERGR